MRNKLIAAGVGLFGYGVFLGWAATKDRAVLREQELTEELETALRRLNVIQGIEQISFPEDPTEVELEAGVGTDQDPSEEISDDEPYDEKVYEERRSNLQRIINNYNGNPAAQEEFQEMLKTSDLNEFAPPFVISREDFAWSEEGDEYDKTTLTYYQRERILLDEDDEVVPDPNTLVGWKSLSQFGGESGDPDVVYIRNRRVQTDFEVVRETENPPPAHILLGMDKTEYETNKAAGLLRFRPEDE